MTSSYRSSSKYGKYIYDHWNISCDIILFILELVLLVGLFVFPILVNGFLLLLAIFQSVQLYSLLKYTDDDCVLEYDFKRMLITMTICIVLIYLCVTLLASLSCFLTSEPKVSKFMKQTPFDVVCSVCVVDEFGCHSKEIGADYDTIVSDVNVGNAIIVYYRYDCPDCEAIHRELISYFKDQGVDVYYISSRSSVGQRLLTIYPTSEVPSGTVVDKNGFDRNRVLYDEDGFDQSAADYLIETMQENAKSTAS